MVKINLSTFLYEFYHRLEIAAETYPATKLIKPVIKIYFMYFFIGSIGKKKL
jgi:hypothetical protein